MARFVFERIGFCICACDIDDGGEIELLQEWPEIGIVIEIAIVEGDEDGIFGEGGFAIGEGDELGGGDGGEALGADVFEIGFELLGGDDIAAFAIGVV